MEGFLGCVRLRNGPVSVRELVTILRAAGKFRNPEKDRANYGTVFSTLQHDERFAKKRGKGEFYLIRETVPDDEPLLMPTHTQ